MSDTVYVWTFRAAATSSLALSVFQLFKLKAISTVRRQLQLLLCLASLGLCLRALDPPYPVVRVCCYRRCRSVLVLAAIQGGSWTGMPLIVFVLADFFSTACLYCVALVFMRFLIVTTASPGDPTLASLARCSCAWLLCWPQGWTTGSRASSAAATRSSRSRWRRSGSAACALHLQYALPGDIALADACRGSRRGFAAACASRWCTATKIWPTTG